MRRSLPYVAPFVVLLLSAGVLCLRWGVVPERYPIHWDLHGRPDGWVVRSFLGLAWPYLLGTGSIAIALTATSRRVPTLSRTAIAVCVGSVFGAAGILPLLSGPLFAVLMSTVALAGVAVCVSIDVRRAFRAGPAPGGWYAGLVYFKADDPRLMVPKLSGLGFTFNLARPVAKVLFAVLLLFPFVVCSVVIVELIANGH